MESGKKKKGNILYKHIIIITRMSSSRKGDRMSAVKVLETTVEGFFSGSLNRCCTNMRRFLKSSWFYSIISQ